MNSPNKPKATNLYRIVPFERAAEIITKRKLYFSHPSTWDDPYERILRHDRSQAIFAQCWCRKAVSDAMWRIYSPHCLGVRIGTTKQRLQQVLEEAKDRKKIGAFKIQNVEYLYEEELQFEMREIRGRLEKSAMFSDVTESLFKKRKAFDHEKECRVVVFDQKWVEGEPAKGQTVDVDPFKVLTNIWLDPRAPEEVLNAYRYYLKDKLGFPGTVARSKLYEAPSELEVQRET